MTVKTATRTAVPEMRVPRPAPGQPPRHQQGLHIQEFGTARQLPIGLSAGTCRHSCQLLDKYAEETKDLVVSDPRRVAELISIPRPPDAVEGAPARLSSLLEAHECILIGAREAAAKAIARNDDGTNDLLVSDVIRTGERHAWFLAEHLAAAPLIRT
jgi:starvation-inducible DNA-binding protein